VCGKDFTHSASLKKHIIKNHESEELEEKNINPELVVGQPLKK
jgi:preprotein translocase subunit Sec61beta